MNISLENYDMSLFFKNEKNLLFRNNIIDLKKKQKRKRKKYAQLFI